MANPDSAYGFDVFKRLGGADVPIETMTTESNVTLAVGDAVAIDTATGLLRLAVAGDTALAGVSTCKITGVAATRATATFVPAISDIVFHGQCSGTPTQASVGDTCDIEGATGVMEVNENGSTTDVIQIVGFHPSTSIGLNAQVLFTIVKSQLYGGTTV
jgi:hypothetical protein